MSSLQEQHAVQGLLMLSPLVVGTQEAQYLFRLERAVKFEGSISAMLQLAQLYAKGHVVKKNLSMAFQYYSMAAQYGHVVSMLQVGLWLLHGKGVCADAHVAFFWMMKAAQQGLARAQFMVCCMYLSGTGVEKDQAQANFWCKLAAQDPAMRQEMRMKGFCF